MIKYKGKSRQLQKGLSLDDLKKIGGSMKAKGHLSLTIDMDRLEKKDLSFLEHFQHLERLIIRGGTQNQIKKITLVPEIKILCLIGVRVNDYSFLVRFESLEILDIRGGGVKDYSSLSELSSLKAILFMDLRALKKVDFLRKLKNLQFIRLDGCSNIEIIPVLKPLNKLKRVELEKMKRLKGICGIADAPNIEELIIYMIRSNLKSTHFRCFLGHPSLHKIFVAIDWLESEEDIKIKNLLRHQLMNGYVGTENEFYSLRS